MLSTILGLLLASTSAVALVPASVSVRSADERPSRRSQEDRRIMPHVQMGAGPTAFAMVALLMAIVGRSIRKRRAASGASAIGEGVP